MILYAVIEEVIVAVPVKLTEPDVIEPRFFIIILEAVIVPADKAFV